MSSSQWPSSRDYVEAIQNPTLCFQEPDLRAGTPAVDRLGMPFVTSGQFAYVFKLNSANGGAAQAVRCFRGAVGDREQRYRQINDHLNKVFIPFFADFEYDPEGILVLGRRYPILVMEWIDGLPLDVYLSNVLDRPDVFKFLADLWLKILISLRNGGVAHGDLQHGNIIVDSRNALRLVDLDGMFVPSMSGWKSSELGHRHYQHPKRSPDDFYTQLDNFSGLVIYLSFLSLAEAPRLWGEYHDENLIFTQADFENPRSSPLFGKIKRLSAEHRRLAEALERACADDPKACPSVLDLVKAPTSKLPAWMVAAPAVEIQQTTREVKPGAAPPPLPDRPVPTAAAGSAAPWWQSGQTAAAPAGQAFQQGAPIAASNPSNLARAGAAQALNYAFVGVFFVWLWLPMLKSIYSGMGMQADDAAWTSVLTFAAACAFMGYRRAKAEAQPKPMPAPAAPYVAPAPRPAPVTVQPPPPVTPRPVSQHPSPAYAALVGSRIRMIYHKPNCRWAQKISFRNRVQFSSVADARTAGYKPCGVCSP